MEILGFDVGVSSVGSAWVDTCAQLLDPGAGVFPAGVEENEKGRGDPKNKDRRSNRSQRRSLARRSGRKRLLRQQLVKWGWIPTDAEHFDGWMQFNPWHLRRKALKEELTSEELGRVLLHMIQRRGASWFDDEDDAASSASGSSKDKEQDKKKKQQSAKTANEELHEQMKSCGAKTFGAFMADLFDQRAKAYDGKDGLNFAAPIRNRNDAEGNTVYEFCPERQLLRNEFLTIWEKQKSFSGTLASQLTDEKKHILFDPQGTATWKQRGLLFGQRNTYWDTGTLGRCDLEPTDQVCSKADMYAQEFLVLGIVNNIRITETGQLSRKLNGQERVKVIAVLEQQKTAKPATVRKALGINRKEDKLFYTLNLDSDPKQTLNTNWFEREIVSAIGEDAWKGLSDREKDSINRAVLKFNPKDPDDQQRLEQGCRDWWRFGDEQAGAFIEAWKTRPLTSKRVNFSRKAIQNLLPYLRDGYSVTEARQLFAEDGDNDATEEQRTRYCLKLNRPTKSIRHFLDKHPGLIPPAPMLSNPVVRKAIHEVRRHLIEHLRKHGKPDRVIVELARDAKHTAMVSRKFKSENDQRRENREKIREEFANILDNMTKTQASKAIERVILCRHQKNRCAYSDDSNRSITECQAARGDGVEVDHIIPQSRGGSNGLHNKVVCYAATNRGKGNKTPKEWLDEEGFAKMEQRFSHWKNDKNKELARKWELLHKEALNQEDYIQSQLTDTAYASKQVVQWLKDVLYGDMNDGKRYVFTTTGKYTAILRRQWGLYYDERNPQAKKKSRADHRHHAIDAILIAFSGPETIRQLADISQAIELAKGQGKQPPKFRIDVPWGTNDSFRGQVTEQIKNLVVSHRPQRRKVAGALHKETQYGPILDKDGELTNEFSQRIFLAKMSPKHLRVPEHWDDLAEKFNQASTKSEQREIRRQMLSLEDVKPEKSGVVRDRWFRYELRQWLQHNELDPDSFTNKQLKALIQGGKNRMPSGVPFRNITLRKIFNNTVTIQRQFPDPSTGKLQYDNTTQSVRVYESQNNHHIEIREDKKGKWIGDVITNFEATCRILPPKVSGEQPVSAVNRKDTERGKFVMSLCVGEMVWMKYPDTQRPGYFVVFKIDAGSTPTIHFTSHWDAGKSKEDENHPAREDIAKSPRQLQELGIEDGQPPEKVWIGPLGDKKALRGD